MKECLIKRTFSPHKHKSPCRVRSRRSWQRDKRGKTISDSVWVLCPVSAVLLEPCEISWIPWQMHGNPRVQGSYTMLPTWSSGWASLCLPRGFVVWAQQKCWHGGSGWREGLKQGPRVPHSLGMMLRRVCPSLEMRVEVWRGECTAVSWPLETQKTCEAFTTEQGKEWPVRDNDTL